MATGTFPTSGKRFEVLSLGSFLLLICSFAFSSVLHSFPVLLILTMGCFLQVQRPWLFSQLASSSALSAAIWGKRQKACISFLFISGVTIVSLSLPQSFGHTFSLAGRDVMLCVRRLSHNPVWILSFCFIYINTPPPNISIAFRFAGPQLATNKIRNCTRQN